MTHLPQAFSVHWRDEGSRVNSCSFISLDGFLVPGRFLHGSGEASRKGVRTGQNAERPFVFAEQSDICEVHLLVRGLAHRCLSATSGAQINRDAGTIMVKIRLASIDTVKPANKLRRLPESSGAQSNMLTHYIR